MPILLAGALWFGGLGLAADERPVTDAPAAAEPVTPTEQTPGPLLPAAAVIGSLLAALAASRKEPGGALGLRPPEDAIVVFVPGHGQGSGPEVFADLIDLMDLDPDDARFFDYRLVTGGADPITASQSASIEDTTRALNAFVGGVAAEERPIWLVGFSKGGATVANLVADWDDGVYGPNNSVEEVFLLDPPIAAGLHGWLQSVGRAVGAIPDDGGYDPVACSFVVWGCDDEREHLGEAAGVDVLVIRNPNAGITNLNDFPDGLRVVDAPDDGPGFWEQFWSNAIGLPARVAAAHESVLDDADVASCLVAEMREPGSCPLEPAGPQRVPAPLLLGAIGVTLGPKVK